MAASALVSPSAGRRGRRRRVVMSDINVTPLVDVMLVLLIIFMVTAPLLTMTIKVDLPQARGSTTLNAHADVVDLTFKKSEGTCAGKADLFIGDSPVTIDQAATKLKAIMIANPKATVTFKSDQAICYSDVAKLLGRLRDAGLESAFLNVVPENAGD